jgi:hypothetical protein
VQKTYEEIAEFDGQARQWLTRNEQNWKKENPEIKSAYPGTKFTYAVNRMLKRSQSALSKYREKAEEINVEHAATDADGILITDERTGQFKFKKDDFQKASKARLELLRSKVEIDPYHATEVPTLSDEEKDVFSDFVLNGANEIIPS